MQKEKIALITLVIIVIAALSVFLIALNTDVFEHLFEEEKVIQYGSYADVNYIGYYTNGSIFESSYNYPENKTGGQPVKIFVTLNSSAVADKNFSAYSNVINNSFVKGFIENLVGMKKGQSKTTSPIPPENAYGIAPKVEDTINFTLIARKPYELKVIGIQKNAPMPAIFTQYFGNKTTTLYILREDSHYIGEVIDTYLDANSEPIWKNATTVTKINETLLWRYTTPSPDKHENLSWVDLNYNEEYKIDYPKNASRILSINNSTMLITHTPKINDTIQFFNNSNPYGVQFIVENVTADKITGYLDNNASAQNRTRREFPRITTIQRNETQNITQPYPREWLEYALSVLKMYDPSVKLSLSPRADQTVYFEISIVNVH